MFRCHDGSGFVEAGNVGNGVAECFDRSDEWAVSVTPAPPPAGSRIINDGKLFFCFELFFN